jgi:hypothetical protein
MGCGPDCPPRVFTWTEYDADGSELVPRGEPGPEPAAPCPRCGRPAEVEECVIIYDPNFYGNADRLAALGVLPRARRGAVTGDGSGAGVSP